MQAPEWPNIQQELFLNVLIPHLALYINDKASATNAIQKDLAEKGVYKSTIQISSRIESIIAAWTSTYNHLLQCAAENSIAFSPSNPDPKLKEYAESACPGFFKISPYMMAKMLHDRQEKNTQLGLFDRQQEDSISKRVKIEHDELEVRRRRIQVDKRRVELEAIACEQEYAYKVHIDLYS